MTTNPLRCDIVFVILLVSSFVSTIIRSGCWPEEENDFNLEMKSILEMSDKDEIVHMAGYGEEKLSNVLITGTLLCYSGCLGGSLRRRRELYPRPISGALVRTRCTDDVVNGEERATSMEVMTDEYGEFIIDVPSRLHAISNFEKACSVMVIQVPENSPCYQSSYDRKQTKIKLSSIGEEIRTYTTGAIAIISKISKNSEACIKGLDEYQKMSL